MPSKKNGGRDKKEPAIAGSQVIEKVTYAREARRLQGKFVPVACRNRENRLKLLFVFPDFKVELQHELPKCLFFEKTVAPSLNVPLRLLVSGCVELFRHLGTCDCRFCFYKEEEERISSRPDILLSPLRSLRLLFAGSLPASSKILLLCCSKIRFRQERPAWRFCE